MLSDRLKDPEYTHRAKKKAQQDREKSVFSPFLSTQLGGNMAFSVLRLLGSRLLILRLQLDFCALSEKTFVVTLLMDTTTIS